MPQDIYEKIMMLAKRRGFIYPSYEIYGGVAGFYDYGPLGSQLKHNIETIWRQFYLLHDSCIEIHTPTITLQEVLQASGHVEEFTDLTVECQQCKQAYKVEDIIDDNQTIEEAIKNNNIKCPSCGKENKDTAKTCKKCGVELTVPSGFWMTDWKWHFKVLSIIYVSLIILYFAISTLLSRVSPPYRVREIPKEMTPWLR